MRLMLIAVLSIVPGQAAGLTGADPKPVRHVEKAGGFSYVPPPQWTIREIPGLKFKGVVGRPVDGFAPNMVFIDEADQGTLAEYMAKNKKQLAAAFKTYKELGEKKLKTEDGAEWVMLVTQREMDGKLLRQTACFFVLSPQRKMVVTCSAAGAEASKLDAVFEASLKTFRLEKP